MIILATLRLSKKLSAALLTLLCLLPLTFYSHAQTTSAPADGDKTETAKPNNTNELPLKDLRLFTLIFDHIRRSYVEPISDQELLENAIKGMLNEMDPHSAYYDANSFERFQESTQGQFSGVGIEMGTEGGFIKVISPIDDTPAQKAGIQAGDIIIKVDQESIQGLSINEAAQKIRGPIGSKVEFTIIREGNNTPFDIAVVRDTIKALSVRSRLIDETIAYIRIAQFQAETGNDFINAVKKLRNDQPELKGLIIDLRNNPGGILQASVQVVDSLINEGLVVYTEGRLENSNTSYRAIDGDDTGGLPIVVLINGGSASASEIVAGALQDHRRAVIMGTRSFGKGSVQTILPVGDKKGIKLTTARYFTPNGRSIQAQGIEPDILVKPATITTIKSNDRVNEASLGKHLKNGNDDDNSVESESEKQESNTDDNQLFEAVNLLKGIAILQTHSKETTAQ